MAAGSAGQVALTITPPLTPRNEPGQESPSPSTFVRGNSFVRSIDRKARSCLKTLERSLSFTGNDESRDEDPSSMTIEFLKARLQAQRAEYKVEKQRAQQLAKKVLELEQRLHAEIERRKMMEHNDALFSPRYSSKLKSFRSYNDRMELPMNNSKFKDSSSGEEHSDCCSEFSNSEDSFLLISPSSLCSHSHFPVQEHQQTIHQHEYSPAKDAIEASETRKVFDGKPRNKPHGDCTCELCASPLRPKPSVDLLSKNDSSDAWSTKDDDSQQLSEITSTIDGLTLRPTCTERLVVQNQPHGKGCSFLEIENDATYCPRPQYDHATKETTLQAANNYLVKPINIQNCQNHTSLADGTLFHTSSSQKADRSQDPWELSKAESLFESEITRNGGDFKDSSTHEYIFAKPNANNVETEHTHTLKQHNHSEYVKAILPLDMIRSLDNYEISLLRPNLGKVPNPYKKTRPSPHYFSSPIQMNQRGRSRQYRISLDGGLDRLRH